MKNLKLIGFLMVIASSLMFIQCTSDPIEGPRGLDGRDGIDGINGTNGTNGTDGQDGQDGTASCVACHNLSHRAAIESSYAQSLHFENTIHSGMPLTEYTNRSFFGGSCTPCHSHEGYLRQVEGLPYIPQETVTKIRCTTCHDKHSTFDFVNDGDDYALRNMAPVTLMIDETTVLDFGGSSNNCTSCHQPRNSYDIPGDTGDYEITSKRFGPHHAPQSTFLYGIMGANIAGSEPYPTPGSAKHQEFSSCTQCHMSADDGGGNGEHTFIVTDNGCAGCHSSGIPTEVTGFAADMETLRGLLAARNMFDADGYYVPGVYTAKEAQAAWNYKTLLEDQSNGIHNPKYAKALLKNSIEALQQ